MVKHKRGRRTTSSPKMDSVFQNKKGEHRQLPTDLKKGAQHILLDSAGINIEILGDCSDTGSPSQPSSMNTGGQIHPAPNLTPKALICPFWLEGTTHVFETKIWSDAKQPDRKFRLLWRKTR
ncbi:hypothetical protein BDV33DRAFT_185131 [Aspergillus novoparasiticus]|uniref:Uncharacterized protein n=1 Tax=Aspergillus novoparasiticus TaxID=986946 RepID=A0A5N6E904_9EURO|nr:hypothetical protein BDV33DRAFT_185131 [Aspergillus novoparasiticus]